MQSIGDVIKARRTALGMSADDLARILKKSRATIYRYESTDIENMPVGVLEPLARALNTTPIELMGWANRQTNYETKDIEEQLPAAGVPHFRKLRRQWEIEKLQEIDHNLAANLKLLLTPLKISAFAESTGINDQGRIGAFLTGVPSELSNDEFNKICEFFDVSPEKLLYTNLADEPSKTSFSNWTKSLKDNYEYKKFAKEIKEEIDFQNEVRGLSNKIYTGCLRVLQSSKFNNIIREAFMDYTEQILLTDKAFKKYLKNPHTRYEFGKRCYKFVANLIISDPVNFWNTYLVKESGAYELAKVMIQRKEEK